MTETPVQIRKPAVIRDIRELAALKGQAMTDVVADAVRGELTRARRASSAEEKRKAVRAIVEELHRLPRLGPPLTDDDLYDENGLPR